MRSPVALSPPTSNTQCYCQQCSAPLPCCPLTAHLKHTVLLPAVQRSVALLPSHRPPQTHSATASSAALRCPVPLSPPTSNTQCYCQQCSAPLPCSPLTAHLKHTVLLPAVQRSVALFPSHRPPQTHSATASSAALRCPVPLSPPTSNTQCYCQQCSAPLPCSPLTAHLKYTVLLPAVQRSVALFPSHRPPQIHSATASSAALRCPVPLSPPTSNTQYYC